MRNKSLSSTVPAGSRYPNAHDSYDPVYFAPLYKAEDRHFWFRARNEAIANLMRQVAARYKPGYRVLEVGCGTGNVLRVLEQTCTGGTVVGMDLFAEGLKYARQRTSCGLVQGDVHSPPFATQFDIIGLFDVLEHLPDDKQVLQDLHNLLKPGGTLLIAVPAHRSLWSYFDEEEHHCRRYETRELRRKLAATGFQIEYLSQYMASLFPLVWLGRRVAAIMNSNKGEQAKRTEDMTTAELRVRPGVNQILSWMLSQENRLLARRRRMPIGTSLVAVARKRQSQGSHLGNPQGQPTQS